MKPYVIDFFYVTQSNRFKWKFIVISYFLINKDDTRMMFIHSMALSTGSSKFWKFWFMILKFSSISNVETTFLKKVFNSSGSFLSSCSILSFLHEFYVTSRTSLVWEKWFDCFRKELIIIDKSGIWFVKEFFMFFFVKPVTIFFSFFVFCTLSKTCPFS